MNKQLLVSAVLTFGLQTVAEATSPGDTEALFGLGSIAAASEDAIWGIGRRAVQPQITPPAAPEADADVIGLSDLEAAFWVCDYVATTRGVEATPVAICGAVYDELKTVKFAGDFGELLDWWKQNKLTEHRKIASDHGDATVERIDMHY
jgi:hypothetical protein